jgi:hypothetical protein
MMRNNNNGNNNDNDNNRKMNRPNKTGGGVSSNKIKRNRSSCRQVGDVKYKKAPQAPIRFKSSYIFFSAAKHKDTRAKLSKRNQEENAIGRVSLLYVLDEFEILYINKVYIHYALQ